MGKNNRKPLLQSQVSRFYIPVKFRMNQRHNKRPGKAKYLTRDEIDRYLEGRENGHAQTSSKDVGDIARHCGPNIRRFSDYEMRNQKPETRWGNKPLPKVGKRLVKI